MKSVVGEKSFALAVRIVRLYRYICRRHQIHVLARQLLRCGTSIGANIREATYGQSRADYLSKMNIALKEAGETCYWIELLMATGYLSSKEASSILADANEVRRMLVSIVKTTRETTG